MPGCGSGVPVSSCSLLIHGEDRRPQAEIPLILLSRFPGPALSAYDEQPLTVNGATHLCTWPECLLHVVHCCCAASAIVDHDRGHRPRLPTVWGRLAACRVGVLWRVRCARLAQFRPAAGYAVCGGLAGHGHLPGAAQFRPAAGYAVCGSCRRGRSTATRWRRFARS